MPLAVAVDLDAGDPPPRVELKLKSVVSGIAPDRSYSPYSQRTPWVTEGEPLTLTAPEGFYLLHATAEDAQGGMSRSTIKIHIVEEGDELGESEGESLN